MKSPYIATTLEELYKFGPGPSSSHTMGPMICGSNFYDLLQEQPDELLSQADDVRVTLYGSLSATGKGHGTDRAVLAGLTGQKPESCDPDFLDDLTANRSKKHAIVVRNYHWSVSLDDLVFGPVKGDFAHPNTLRIALMKNSEELMGRTYYSVGGGFVEWEGYQAPTKAVPPYPYSTFEELKNYVSSERSLVDVLLDNEMALSGKTETEVWQFLQKVMKTMSQCVERGLNAKGMLPGSLELESKAQRLFTSYEGSEEATLGQGISVVSALAIAASEENARGHVIVTAPTAGSCGVLAGAVKTMLIRPQPDRRKICEGLLIAAAIGFLCKHNATLSGAEGGCQAEIGVASAMAAAFLGHYRRGSVRIVDNAAESALEHHLGLTCDPVGGYVQIPCIERNAFGVIKAWTAVCIACDEARGSHKVGFDQCVEAMALTAKAMSSKYKETSEGGLALVFC